MHIADVTMFHAPESGGVRRYLLAKREWLRTQPGLRHTLVVPTTDGSAEEDVTPAPRLQTLLVPSVPLPFSHGYRLPLARRAAAEAMLALHPDVIEAGDPYRLAWAALDASGEARIPAIAFCHSDLPALVSRWGGPRAGRLAEAYIKRLYSRFDCVLAPSRVLTGRLRALGIRAQYQPLGVDTGIFTPARRASFVRARLGFADDDRLLVYAGRFSPEKNLDVLYDALTRLGGPYRLLMIGGGMSLPSHPGVRVLPFVRDRATLAGLIAACDAFVHPGDQETFGLAALEAMACGTPVVGVRAAGIAELVGDDGVLVEPRSARSLAEGIALLWQLDRGALSVAARRRAERYDWNRVLPRLLRRYQLLARARDRA